MDVPPSDTGRDSRIPAELLGTPVRRYVFAVVATAIAALARSSLDPLLGATSEFLIYYFSVMVVAVLAGVGPGFAAIGLGALAGLAYFVWTGHSSGAWIDDIARMALFVLFGLLAVACAGSLHAARRRATSAAESLRLASRQLRLLAAGLEASPNAISLSETDEKGTIVWVNAAFTRLTGYTSKEVIGKSHHVLASGQHGDAFYRQLWETIKRGEVWRGELVNCRKDGTLYHEEMGITPLRDEAGKITHYVAVKQDITARKLAQEALSVSEQKFNAAFAANPAAIVLTRLSDGVFLEVNDTWETLFGYRREEAIGQPSMTFRIWPSREERDRYVQELLRNGSFHGWEQPFRKKSGEIIVTQLAAQLLDVRGEKVALATAVDITARKQAEESLRRSEERLRALVTASSNVIYRMSPDWSQMLQLYSENFLTNTESPSRTWLSDYIPPETQRLVNDTIARAIRQKSVFELEHQVRRADGTIGWTFSRAVPLLDAKGEVIEWFGAASDITERVEMQLELEAARLSAEQARQAAEAANKAKDHFLAVLSHELRTPLTAVLPALEELGKMVPPEAQEDLEMVLRNVELEARLIDDLLDVTRISRGKIELQLEPVDLCTVVQRAAEVCAPDIEARQLHFDIKVDNGPHLINADPARLQQVFWNLIKNAVKFTPHDGCVWVHCYRDGAHVTADVNDSGLGVEPAALPRIFNAFEQANRTVTKQFGGLGLGLAISKTLVELHGGSIHAQSEGLGKGATFSVRLPIYVPIDNAAPASRPGLVAVATGPTTVRAYRILLVEDHGDTSRIMSRMLRSKGHQVETAGDVAAALELAGSRAFDLLVSDLGLPDRSGLELMQELRGSGKAIPAIALSGYGQEEDIRRSHEAGFAEHLTKPVNMRQLESAISRVTHFGG